MKVVLFCGGLGMRLREYSESVPKPMVPIGHRPILWHLMKYYAHYGHKDFILCLGWQANVVKEYFLNYDECVTNDFVLQGDGKVQLLQSDIHDWTITFVDTGINANIGQRLKAIEPFLEGEEVFLANYTDGLTDLPLPEMIEHFSTHDSIASCMSVRPIFSLHLIDADEDGKVNKLTPITDEDLWMNAGFFIFRSEIFNYLGEGEELVAEPFERLASARQLQTYRYSGFWGCMDTYKEKQILDRMYEQGSAPWTVWEQPSANKEHQAVTPVIDDSENIVENYESIAQMRTNHAKTTVLKPK